jgi:hypothetical protein
VQQVAALPVWRELVYDEHLNVSVVVTLVLLSLATTPPSVGTEATFALAGLRAPTFSSQGPGGP